MNQPSDPYKMSPKLTRSVDPGADLDDADLGDDPMAEASSPELAHWQHLLAPVRADIPTQLPPVLQALTQRLIARPRRRWALRFAQAAVVVIAVSTLLTAALLSYRLQWKADGAWAVEKMKDGSDVQARWSVGTTLSDTQALSVRVARIGHLELAPGTQVRLLASAVGKHRIALEVGQIHARIWAPPAWFAVQVGPAEIVDLGCEFTLDVTHERSDLEVLSGWVAYRFGTQEVLVPAGYRLHFDTRSASLPVHRRANAEFANALGQLQSALKQMPVDLTTQNVAIQALLEHAQTSDTYSLLSALTQHPKLANSALFPRLMVLLDLPSEAAFRRAWAAGDVAAIERGWQQLPVQPKSWWRNWPDAW